MHPNFEKGNYGKNSAYYNQIEVEINTRGEVMSQ